MLETMEIVVFNDLRLHVLSLEMTALSVVRSDAHSSSALKDHLETLAKTVKGHQDRFMITTFYETPHAQTSPIFLFYSCFFSTVVSLPQSSFVVYSYETRVITSWHASTKKPGKNTLRKTKERKKNRSKKKAVGIVDLNKGKKYNEHSFIDFERVWGKKYKDDRNDTLVGCICGSYLPV